MGKKANDLTNAIVQTLNACGYLAWPNQSTGIYDPVKKIFRKNPRAKKGVSDILAIIPTTGRMLAVEVKIGSDRNSPEQEQFQQDVTRKGALSIVAKTYDQFITDLIHGLNSDEMHTVDCLLRGYSDKPVVR